MFVYMSRKKRQVLADVMAELYGPDNGERQSSAGTVRGAVSQALDAIHYVDEDYPDDGFVGEAVEVLRALAAASAPVLPYHLRPGYLARQLCWTVRGRVHLAYHRRWRCRQSQPPSDMQREAVRVVTTLVSNGEAEKVKAALAMVGRRRVVEIREGDIPTFLAALAP